MRRFEFRLESVLRWRRSQLDMEQVRLRILLEELARIQASIAELDDAQGPQRVIVHSPVATAGERSGLDQWIRWARLERDCRVSKAGDCERRISEQRARLLEARRKLELLEKLRMRRHAEWNVELNKEVEQIAAEAWAAGWART